MDILSIDALGDAEIAAILERASQFFLGNRGRRATERLHGKIVFTHTEVPSAHEGQGIGSSLIRFALKSARERGLQVIPICPFFAAYIRKHAEEQDLLDPAFRKVLGLE